MSVSPEMRKCNNKEGEIKKLDETSTLPETAVVAAAGTFHPHSVKKARSQRHMNESEVVGGCRLRSVGGEQPAAEGESCCELADPATCPARAAGGEE